MLESWRDSPVQFAKLTLCETRAALVLRDQRTVIKFLFHDRKSRRGDLAMQYAVQRVVTLLLFHACKFTTLKSPGNM
jgi:hypothetical protein